MIDEAALLIMSSVLLGLASACAILACQAHLERWLTDERAWIQQYALRFTPNPVNTTLFQGIYIAARVGMLVLLLLVIPNLILAVVFWGGCLLVPKHMMEFFWQRRRQRIDEQIPSAVLTMAHSVHAGLTLVQAINRLAERAPNPIRIEFRIMANRYALGADFEETIRQAQRRLKLPNMNLFASALLVNREMGGGIAETLERIARSLEKLKELRQTVKAATAEGRTNIKALSVAPAVVIGFLYLMDPDGVILMFNTIQGYIVLGGVFTLNALGILWASKIVGAEF